ncbi:MAG: penicillin-binding transpeptidase domain-containing protein [Planctomycetota bacterium]
MSTVSPPQPSTNPRPFLRRLLFIGFGGGLGVLVLLLRVFVVAAERTESARDTLDQADKRVELLPTRRGRVLDARGRVLAQSRTVWEVRVPYAMLSDAWARTVAERSARLASGRSLWRALPQTLRDQRVAKVLPSVEEWRHDLYTRLAKVDGRPVEELYERAEEIVTQVERSQASFERRQRAKYEAQFGPPPAGWSPGMIRERTLSYPLLQTDQTVGFEFEQWAEMARSAFREVDIDLDDLEVRSRDERQYPLASIEVELADSSFPTSLRRFGGRYLVEGCASDLLGSLGPVGAEHIEQHPFGLQNEDALGGYRVGDEVGIRGIEAAQESTLRGSLGFVQRSAVGSLETKTIEPQPGQDIQLHLDFRWQAVAEALLDPALGLCQAQANQKGTLPAGTPLAGSLVLVELATGNIQVAAGRPLATEADGPTWRRGGVVRATEAILAPGSIVKPFLLVAGLSEGKVRANEQINCQGYFFPDKRDRFRCWIANRNAREHGPLDAADALAHSCNVYFYEVGRRLGLETEARWLRRFGFGERPEVGLLYQRELDRGPVLLGETSGRVPDPATVPRGQRVSEAMSSAIGQSALVCSPLQAAIAYARLGARGALPHPELVASGNARPVGETFPDAVIDPVLVGLRRVLSERYGTGRDIEEVPGCTILGKTGTAEAPPITLGVGAKTDGTHAWFAGLIGPTGQAPTHSFVSVVEYGGSGGRTAGPLATAFLRELARRGAFGGPTS